MTKREAVAEFRATILPSVPPQDIPWRDQAWNDYTDYLCKEGLITLRQYETWGSPFGS